MDKKRALNIIEEAGHILIIMVGVERTYQSLGSMVDERAKELGEEIKHIKDAEAERLLKKVFTAPYEQKVLCEVLAKQMSPERVERIKERISRQITRSIEKRRKARNKR
jgi:hypothetical protein